jgi:single-stranded-DNA-specific exonuclease
MEKRWIISPPDGRAESLAGYLGVSPIIGQLLLNRGMYNTNAAAAFLLPSLRQLHDPSLMSGMIEAVPRIVQAIQAREKITVYGDYDVDGVSGTTTMYHALRFLGADVHTYIPHRIDEGYGMNPAAINKIIDEGTTLLITVDCGITGLESADACMLRGIDLIITDHHEWKEELPVAYAIVHPRLEDVRPTGRKYPNRDLCGAGVAFKVAWAVGQAMNGGERCHPDYSAFLQELISFTALGTIADVVSLTGENRTIAHFGLSRIPQSRFAGLQALVKSARMDGREIDGYDVGFCLAPRLNAAGRLGHANDALGMLKSEDYEAALATGQELEARNRERQETQRDIAKGALAQAAALPQTHSRIVTGEGWHSGVVGIVASRVVETFYRPAMVLVDSGDELHGSGRSIEGFNMAAGLKACDDLLERWGGHAMACGLKLKKAHLEEFRRRFDAYAQEHIDPELLKPRGDIDAVVRVEQIDESLVHQIRRMGPFGQGNRRPLFMIEDAVVRDPKTMGKEGKHLAFRATQGGASLKCVAFGLGEEAHKYPTDCRVDLVVEPTLNTWKDRTSVELLLREIRVK